MKTDSRQLRTRDKKVLIGYRAMHKGKKVLAIMSGTDERTWQCLGVIEPYELLQQMDSGPYINLDNII